MRSITVRFITCSILILLSYTTVKSANIKGHVTDSVSKENLIGVTVFIKDNTQLYDVAGLEGSYDIKGVAPGNYMVVAQLFGYITQEKSVVIADAQQTVVIDFNLNSSSLNLGQVKITAVADKGSDSYARTEEKTSNNILNIMSLKTIQLLPDVTIGDVLQRVSGVVAQKSVTGGGKYATIRGMDKQYNYTTIDDVKIPSPDYKNRYVPMDVFPAEMVERLEVIKTLTPDKEGDAIGGAMNLVLKDAPDLFSLSANVGSGFNQTLLNKGYEQFNSGVINIQSPNQVNGVNYVSKVSDFPTANILYKDVSVPPDIFSGFTIGDRFFGGKFGVLASVNYQNTYSATEEMFIKPQSQPNYTPTFNYPLWDYISNRYYSVQQTRAAGHVKLDYVFNPKHKITFYTVYTQMNQIRSRIEQDTDNIVNGSEMDPHYQSQVIYQHILNTTLKGYDTLLPHLMLDWTAAYSKAWENIPDWDDISVTGYVGSPSLSFSTLSRVWMQSSDEDFAGYINLTYDMSVLGRKIELKAGAMNRDKSRNAFYAEYDFDATPGQPQYTDITEILNNPKYYSFTDNTGSPYSPNTYSVQEDIMAYYAMAKIMLFPKLQVLGGMRVENTSQAYQDGEPPDIPGQNGAKQYTDYLPSIELKYDITEKQAVRLSYFASISRPSFFDIVPYQLSGDYYTEVGNPFLLHTQANNYDLRWEYFPGPSDQILAGVFYKQIYDPIEIAVLRGTGPSSTLVQPINIGGDSAATPAINYGFEFVYTKYFKHFGISANYTYTHSRITVPSQKYSEVNGHAVQSDTTETRPMQGQTDNIANISLMYRESKIGLEAQVSAVYTGKSIDAVSLWYGLDIWQMPMTRLDFSFQKRLSKKLKLSLFGKVMNILNTPLVLRMFPPNDYQNIKGTSTWLPNQDTNNGNLSSIVVQKTFYGQTYLMGIRYKF